jgi:hypothetical protein
MRGKISIKCRLENQKGKDNLEKAEHRKEYNIKMNLRELIEKCVLDLFRDSFEHGNEPLGLMKYRNLLTS